MRGRDSKQNRESQAFLINELRQLKQLEHPHLVRIVASYTDNEYISYLMQPVAEHSLDILLTQPKRLMSTTKAKLRRFYGCLAGAVNFLHRNKVRHRDLTARNILIRGEEVYICDFGSAYNWSHRPTSATRHLYTPVSPDYMAPEVARREERDSKSDMFSLGVVFLEMTTKLLNRTTADLRKTLQHHAKRNKVSNSYVYANLSGAIAWLDELRKGNNSFEHDNEPIAWVRLLLEENPRNRPSATCLMRDILESPSFLTFRCWKCHPEYENRTFEYDPAPEQRGPLIDSLDISNTVASMFGEPQFGNDGSHRYTIKNERLETWLQVSAGVEEETMPIMVAENTIHETSPIDESRALEVVRTPGSLDQNNFSARPVSWADWFNTDGFGGDFGGESVPGNDASEERTTMEFAEDAVDDPLPSVGSHEDFQEGSNDTETDLRDSGLGFQEYGSSDSEDDSGCRLFNEVSDGSETSSEDATETALFIHGPGNLDIILELDEASNTNSEPEISPQPFQGQKLFEEISDDSSDGLRDDGEAVSQVSDITRTNLVNGAQQKTPSEASSPATALMNPDRTTAGPSALQDYTLAIGAMSTHIPVRQSVAEICETSKHLDAKSEMFPESLDMDKVSMESHVGADAYVEEVLDEAQEPRQEVHNTRTVHFESTSIEPTLRTRPSSQTQDLSPFQGIHRRTSESKENRQSSRSQHLKQHSKTDIAETVATTSLDNGDDQTPSIPSRILTPGSEDHSSTSRLSDNLTSHPQKGEEKEVAGDEAKASKEVSSHGTKQPQKIDVPKPDARLKENTDDQKPSVGDCWNTSETPVSTVPRGSHSSEAKIPMSGGPHPEIPDNIKAVHLSKANLRALEKSMKEQHKIPWLDHHGPTKHTTVTQPATSVPTVHTAMVDTWLLNTSKPDPKSQTDHQTGLKTPTAPNAYEGPEVPMVSAELGNSVPPSQDASEPNTRIRRSASASARRNSDKTSPTGRETLSVPPADARNPKTHQAGIPSPPRKNPRKNPRKRAPLPPIDVEALLKSTWETASAPTSVMSNTTAKRLSNILVPYNSFDTSHHLLEEYCKAGKTSAVKFLLQKGCNPGTKQRPRRLPLLAAIQGASERHNKCVHELIKYDVDVNVRSKKSRKPALHIAIEAACTSSYVKLIWLLVNAGADLNKLDDNGDSALTKLFSGSDLRPLELHHRGALAVLLHVQGGDVGVNQQAPATGNTVLHLAVRRKDPWAVAMLLYKGADVNVKNFAGSTPLQLTASQFRGELSRDHAQVLDRLLDAKCSIDERAGKLKRTALHLAVFSGTSYAVRLLLKHGANPSLVDSEGRDAMQLAIKGAAKLTSIPDRIEDHAEIMDQLTRSLGDSWLKVGERAGAKGMCAVEAACSDGGLDILGTLVCEGGLDGNSKFRGKSVSSLAKSKGNLGAVTYLKKNNSTE